MELQAHKGFESAAEKLYNVFLKPFADPVKDAVNEIQDEDVKTVK